MRREVPELELLFHTAANGLASHDATQHVGGLGQVTPVFVRQAVDILQKHRAVPQQLRARVGLVVQGPFQAGVANIEG